MLARREVSRASLREALRRAGLDEDQVAAELEAAVRLGALDDRRSVRARARDLVLRGGLGEEGMHRRLVAQGYAPDLAAEALAETIREEGWEPRAVAARMLVPGEPAARSARRLLARGFAAALVRELIPGLEGMDEGG